MKQILVLLTILWAGMGIISCDSTRHPANLEVQETRLLSSQNFVGVDMSASIRTCKDRFDQLTCSEEFSESDAFALDCERSGKFAIQCGCHDWICVDDLDSNIEQGYQNQ